MLRLVVTLGFILFYVTELRAEEVRVAVASNFAGAARAIAAEFTRTTDIDVVFIVGSSGKHAAQIKNGLKVDVFLAADCKRPRWLERQGIAIKETRFTYAFGRLALWGSDGLVADRTSLNELSVNEHLAIANPRLAPYGAAAVNVLKQLGVYENLSKQLVRGENIAQAFQFVRSGNAVAGLVAYSQVKDRERGYWLIPADLHEPIEQQVVLLNGRDSAKAFHQFLKSDKALELMQNYGYDTP